VDLFRLLVVAEERWAAVVAEAQDDQDDVAVLVEVGNSPVGVAHGIHTDAAFTVVGGRDPRRSCGVGPGKGEGPAARRQLGNIRADESRPDVVGVRRFDEPSGRLLGLGLDRNERSGENDDDGHETARRANAPDHMTSARGDRRRCAGKRLASMIVTLEPEALGRAPGVTRR